MIEERFFMIDRIVNFRKKLEKYKIACLLSFFGFVLILFDQVIKLCVENSMNLNDSVVVVPGMLRITYLQNRGAAFSIMSGQTLFLIIIALIIISALVGFIIKKKIKDLIYLISITMIISGGVGNLIDRAFRGYVVDYLDTIFWPMEDFAVFNFADCLVVVGCLMFISKIIFNEFICDKCQKNKRENYGRC